MVSETPAGEGLKDVRFRQTRPLPSYLVAFGVGPFEITEARAAGKKHVPVRIIAPRGRGFETAWAARVTPEILEGLEEYFGMAYPYEKLDVLAIPFTVQFGAMENVGLVTFSESLALTRPSRTGWRGDGGTPRWRPTSSPTSGSEISSPRPGGTTSGSTRPSPPGWRPRSSSGGPRHGGWLPSGWRSRDLAAEADALVAARIVRQPVRSYNDVRNAFDAITYDKGAAVLRMFEEWVGEDTFRRGIQQYLRAHADGNATAADFLRAISDSAGQGRRPGVQYLSRPPGHSPGAGHAAMRKPRGGPAARPGSLAARGLHRGPCRPLADPDLRPLEHEGEGADPLHACSTRPPRS